MSSGSDVTPQSSRVSSYSNHFHHHQSIEIRFPVSTVVTQERVGGRGGLSKHPDVQKQLEVISDIGFIVHMDLGCRTSCLVLKLQLKYSFVRQVKSTNQIHVISFVVLECYKRLFFIPSWEFCQKEIRNTEEKGRENLDQMVRLSRTHGFSEILSA